MGRTWRNSCSISSMVFFCLRSMMLQYGSIVLQLLDLVLRLALGGVRPPPAVEGIGAHRRCGGGGGGGGVG